MEPPIEAVVMPANAETGATSTRAEALHTTLALIQQARRFLWVRAHRLEPGLFDSPATIEALRALAVRNAGHAEIRFLLRDSTGLALSPLQPLLQRLTSSFFVREVHDPADLAYPSAWVANDGGGSWFRPLASSFEGQAAFNQAGTAKQLRENFLGPWERARPCTELRVLGI